MDFRPDSRSEVSEEYIIKRAGGLKHFIHRYGALNPEIDCSVPTAFDYDVDLEDSIDDYPENVEALAETLGYTEDNFTAFEMKDVVRELHHSIYDEAARLKALKEDMDLEKETELAIDDAFSLIISLDEPEGRVRSSGEGVPESSSRKGEDIYELFGDDISLRETEGVFMPLAADINKRYQQIRDLSDFEDSLEIQELQTIRSGLTNFEEFFSV